MSVKYGVFYRSINYASHRFTGKGLHAFFEVERPLEGEELYKLA